MDEDAEAVGESKMITLSIHVVSLLIGFFFGLFLGIAAAFWATKDDFSRGYDVGFKNGKERGKDEITN